MMVAVIPGRAEGANPESRTNYDSATLTELSGSSTPKQR